MTELGAGQEKFRKSSFLPLASLSSALEEILRTEGLEGLKEVDDIPTAETNKNDRQHNSYSVSTQ